MTNQNRVQPGVREGGQFATTARPEPENLTLAGPSADESVGPAEWSPFRHAPRSLDGLWPTVQEDFDFDKYEIPAADRTRIAQEFDLNFEPEKVELQADYSYDDEKMLDVTFTAPEAGGYKVVGLNGNPLEIAAVVAARCAPHPTPAEVIEAAGGKPINGWSAEGVRHTITSEDQLERFKIVLASRGDVIAKNPSAAWSHGATGWDRRRGRDLQNEALLASATRMRDAGASFTVADRFESTNLGQVPELKSAGVVHTVEKTDPYSSRPYLARAPLDQVTTATQAEAVARLGRNVAQRMNPHMYLEQKIQQLDHLPDDEEIAGMAEHAVTEGLKGWQWEQFTPERAAGIRAALPTVEDHRNAIEKTIEGFLEPRA